MSSTTTPTTPTIPTILTTPTIPTTPTTTTTTTNTNMSTEIKTTKTNVVNNIDQVFSYLGDIGHYQWKIYLMSLLPAFIAGMLSTTFVFSTAIPEHRCLVSGCDSEKTIHPQSLQELFNNSFVTFSIPKGLSTSSCRMFESNSNSSCSKLSYDSQHIHKCDHYVFNEKYFDSTIVTEFDLFCDKSWIVQLLQSLFFFGVLLGAIFNGILADRYGRRLIFIIYSPITVFAILLSMFAPSAIFYGIGLFIKGMCVAALYQSGFTLGIECLGGRWRFWLGNFFSVVFAIGGIYSSWTAYMLRHWRATEASQLIPVIPMLFNSCFLSESMRWQFSAGKLTEGLNQLSQAAKKNQVEIPDEIIESYIQNRPSVNHEEPAVSIFDLFTNSLIRRWTIAFLYIWFTTALVYYGLAFLASDINENVYLSMALLMAVEFPGIMITTYLGEFGRKNVLISALILGGCSCIISSFVEPGTIRMLLAILGKMAISGSFALIFVYAAEIFPTILRITGIGMCSFSARGGAMIAPYILRLQIFGNSVPFLVIGIITLIAGLFGFILPETKGKKLPDTLEEVEQLKYPATHRCFFHLDQLNDETKKLLIHNDDDDDDQSLVEINKK